MGIRRRTLAVAAAASVLAIGPSAVVQSAHAAVSISVVQHGGTWQGKYHWLRYPTGDRLTGSVAGVHRGTPVRLQAQTFPFTKAFATIAQTTTGTAGAYTSKVTPSLATHYRVRSGGVTSRTVTYYVFPAFKLVSQNLCVGTGPTCGVSVAFYNWIPSSVAHKETTKKTYLYVGINSTAPQRPPTLFLHPSFTQTITRVAANKWLFQLHFSYQRAGALWVQWATCTRETETSDGFGLPVHTGCGAASVPDRSARLAVLG